MLVQCVGEQLTQLSGFIAPMIENEAEGAVRVEAPTAGAAIAVEEDEDLEILEDEAREAIPAPLPVAPGAAERAAHCLTHLPFADWCSACVKSRAVDDPHTHRCRTSQSQACKSSSSTICSRRVRHKMMVCSRSCVVTQRRKDMALEAQRLPKERQVM